jgi:hypothetical protein
MGDDQEGIPSLPIHPFENASNTPTVNLDPFADYPDLPASLDRRNRIVPNDRRPALGPEGDSLDDLQ